MKFKLPKNERLSPNHDRKISAVLFEFAEEIAPADSPPDVLEHAVAIAAALWNFALLPEANQKEGMVKLRQTLGTAGQPLLDVELTSLLDLRKARYAADRRFIADFKLRFEKEGPRLTVASWDMDRSSSAP
jgi:hypothetical protein